jgi:hypothetical protein
MNQWMNSSLVYLGHSSKRAMYLEYRASAASTSLSRISRRPWVLVLEGSWYFLIWYWGLLPGGRGLKPTS